MALYQGRALRAERPVARVGLVRRVVHVLIVGAVIAVTTQVPWSELRRQVAVVTDVQVEGAHYLDAARVSALAGLHPGLDLLSLDLARARQALLLHPRIARAEVERVWPRGLRVRIVEREPAMLVAHGVSWEVDSSGVLLAPLASGVVADVPLLAGPRFDRYAAGTQVRTVELLRGLRWVQALADPSLQLGGQVSEIDVSDGASTGVLLMSGTRVMAPAWPPDTHELSALRVVLADLQHRGLSAEEVDLRFNHQVIVRPVAPAPNEPAGTARRS